MHFHSWSFACILWLQATQSSAQIVDPPRDTITIATENFVVGPTQVVFYSSETILPGSVAVSIDGQAVSADLNNDLFVDGTEVITGGPTPSTATDTNIGIPYVGTSCTDTACIVGIYDLTTTDNSVTSSGTATGTPSNIATATGSYSSGTGSASQDTGLFTGTGLISGSGTTTGSYSSATGSASQEIGLSTGTGLISGSGTTTGSYSSESGSDTGLFTGTGSVSRSGTTMGTTSSASGLSTGTGSGIATNTNFGTATQTGTGTDTINTNTVADSNTLAVASVGTGSRVVSSGGTSTGAVAPASSVYTIDGVPFTGNPTTGLAVGSTTLTPGGPALTISGHTYAIPASATGNVISVDGSLTTLPTPAPSTTTGSVAAPGSTQGGGAPITTAPTSTYTLDGIAFTGNPTSLAVGSTTLTPGGSALTISGHTFAIPASATGGQISVDGSLTDLPLATGTGNLGTGSATSGASAVAGLGAGYGPVVSITLSDASTTATYDAVVISQYQNIQTPTIIVTSFPEYNSVGSVTSVLGSIIVGKGGTALIHPPHLPTPGGIIGPPGFGGPIRPPSGGGGCPSFFGIPFCPPGIDIEPPGFPDLDPGDLPEGPDPENPDDSEGDDDNKTDENQSNSEDQKTQTDETTKTSATQPSSVSATTTASSAATSSVVSSTCTACDSCITYDYAPNATPNPLDDDSDAMRKRALAGRYVHNKRANNYASSVTASIGAKACAVSRFTVKPPYPGPGTIANNEGNPAPEMVAFYATATYWAVPTNPSKCGPAPGWDFLSTEEIAAFKPPWGLGGKGKSVNTDHVYEVSILDEFFASQISAGFSCQDVTALFDQTDGTTGGTRLNTIFSQLPSLINPDFLGMDSALNRLKGSFWNPGLQGTDLGMANPLASVQSLSNLAVVMAIANNPKISGLFAATNARIYSAFKGVDALITAQEGCKDALKDSQGQAIEATWASAYSVYMTAKITSQNKLITATASVLSAAIPTDANAAKPKDKGNVKNLSTFISNFNAAFQIASLTFPQPGDWPNNALPIQRRDGPACSLNPSANPSVSITAGGSGTVVTGSGKTATSTGTGTGGVGGGGGSGNTATSTSGSSSVSTGGTSKTIITGPITTSAAPPLFTLLCSPFQDPDAGPAAPECQCDGLDGFYPYLSSTSGQSNYNPCGYTTSPTTAPATSIPGFTTTESDGDVVSCASSTYFNYVVNTIPTCAGATQVVSTVASIASLYSAAQASSASVASVASASAASASAAWASATAVPMAGCWILADDGWGDSLFQVYDINGWAGDGGSKLWDQENGCGWISGPGGAFSGPVWETGIQTPFEGGTIETESAIFGLSFFKGGCVERAVHSAGGPPPGTGLGELACQHYNGDLSDTQLSAVNSIKASQLAVVQSLANGGSTTGTSGQLREDEVIQPGASAAPPAASVDPAVVASAAAALPHLLAAQSGASSAPTATATAT